MTFETVIFAAGIGSRLCELGTKMPKALLPVWRNDGCLEPILIKLINQSVNAGTSKVYVITNHRSKDIGNLLKKYRDKFEIPIHTVFQKELDGEAGGLFYIKNIEHPILALDGDNYLTNDSFFLELLSYYSDKNCFATIGVMEVPDIHRYANVKISSEYTLLDIIEKPKNGMEFGSIAKMGCYVLSPQLISKGKDFFRDADGNITTTAAFSNLCRNNEIAFCVKYNGEYLDIGTTDAYISHLKNFKSLIEW